MKYPVKTYALVILGFILTPMVFLVLSFWYWYNLGLSLTFILAILISPIITTYIVSSYGSHMGYWKSADTLKVFKRLQIVPYSGILFSGFGNIFLVLFDQFFSFQQGTGLDFFYFAIFAIVQGLLSSLYYFIRVRLGIYEEYSKGRFSTSLLRRVFPSSVWVTTFCVFFYMIAIKLAYNTFALSEDIFHLLTFVIGSSIFMCVASVVLLRLFFSSIIKSENS